MSSFGIVMLTATMAAAEPNVTLYQLQRTARSWELEQFASRLSLFGTSIAPSLENGVCIRAHNGLNPSTIVWPLEESM